MATTGNPDVAAIIREELRPIKADLENLKKQVEGPPGAGSGDDQTRFAAEIMRMFGPMMAHGMPGGAGPYGMSGGASSHMGAHFPYPYPPVPPAGPWMMWWAWLMSWLWVAFPFTGTGMFQYASRFAHTRGEFWHHWQEAMARIVQQMINASPFGAGPWPMPACPPTKGIDKDVVDKLEAAIAVEPLKSLSDEQKEALRWAVRCSQIFTGMYQQPHK